MPQLNPSPWLAIMLFSWMTFLIIVLPKIMAHLHPNEPVLRDSGKFETGIWNWPWL
uniref:ATP synthase complex subunit 8 n=1 Tax=Johnius borneensis TaxID=499536 RepID=A0A481U9S1_9TELE|nr:ATP synthase F0 subunit 8 [Johnius borneensis]QBI38037.1 ATP synthase F0 subunit 8 [Johnius borneensis]